MVAAGFMYDTIHPTADGFSYWSSCILAQSPLAWIGGGKMLNLGRWDASSTSGYFNMRSIGSGAFLNLTRVDPTTSAGISVVAEGGSILSGFSISAYPDNDATVPGGFFIGNPQNKIVFNRDGGMSFGTGLPPVSSSYELNGLYSRAVLRLNGNAYNGGSNFLDNKNSGGTLVSSIDNLGNFIANVAGVGLKINEGSNARMGAATLASGTVTVSNTSVTANTRIFLTVQSLGTVTAPKAVAITARTAATSFTVTSDDATDTSVVAWELIEPAP